MKNANLIRKKMDEQNKGLRTIANLCDISAITASKIRDGKDVTTYTLEKVLKELGLRLVIEVDETATPQPYVRKKRKSKK